MGAYKRHGDILGTHCNISDGFFKCRYSRVDYKLGIYGTMVFGRGNANV